MRFNELVSEESLAKSGPIRRLILVHGAGQLQKRHQELIERLKSQGVKDVSVFDKFPTELFQDEHYWDPPSDGVTALLLDDCLEVNVYFYVMLYVCVCSDIRRQGNGINRRDYIRASLTSSKFVPSNSSSRCFSRYSSTSTCS